jgi:hypothetical protein
LQNSKFELFYNDFYVTLKKVYLSFFTEEKAVIFYNETLGNFYFGTEGINKDIFEFIKPILEKIESKFEVELSG